MSISGIGRGGFTPIIDTLRSEAKPSATGADKAAGAGFVDKLRTAVQTVDDSVKAGEDAVAALASGENVDIHGTMIAMEKADISLRMTVSARDKFIAAYEQIMNMAI